MGQKFQKEVIQHTVWYDYGNAHITGQKKNLRKKGPLVCETLNINAYYIQMPIKHNSYTRNTVVK